MSAPWYEGVLAFVQEQRETFEEIPAPRRVELQALSEYVRERLQAGAPVALTFICTHNSRRSHFCQIWARLAAEVYGLSDVETFSGGTEVTAMNERVVHSLRGLGFEIETDNPEASNPQYLLRYSNEAEPLRCYSKCYDDPANPETGYAAVMTCSSADDACPIVSGCDVRLAIRYEDPKVSDDTDVEEAVYLERSAQICREMLYAMSLV